jgi:hypothetical protein
VADTYCVMYFVLLAFILCVQCYQFLWIVQSWLFLRFSLTFIWNRNDMDTYYLSTMIRIRSQCFIVLFKVYVIMYVFKPQMLLLSPPPFLMWSCDTIHLSSLKYNHCEKHCCIMHIFKEQMISLSYLIMSSYVTIFIFFVICVEIKSLRRGVCKEYDPHLVKHLI